MLTYRRSSALRLVAVVFALVMGLALALGAMLSAAQAAPQELGALKQFRVPTADSQPRHITVGADGNLWFTEGNEFFTPDPDPEMGGTFHNQIGRISPAGEITEFRVENCQCFLNDIVQGPNNILYFTTNNAGLGRITTSGEVLEDVAPVDEQGNPIFSAIGNGIAAHGDDIWFTDFNNNSLWRYNVSTGNFTQFEVPTPGAGPYDVAVDANGIVWFTEGGAGAIGSLDPQSGTFAETPVPGGDDPRQIAIASDGTVWFTERFSHAIGRLDPSNNNEVTEFPLAFGAGPEGIVAAPDGSVWFTQSSAGNVARITPDGVITEGKSSKGSEPFGITIGPDGQSVWYAMMSANKIARLTPR